MKAAGVLCLLAACVAMGWRQTAALRRRVAVLEAAFRLAVWLTEQVRFSAAPLPELLTRAVDRPIYAPLELDSGLLRAVSERGFAAGWRAHVARLARSWGLTDEDTALLTAFGEGWGTTDTEGQVAHGCLFQRQLNRQKELAEQICREKSRVYTVLWSAGGLALILLLL